MRFTRYLFYLYIDKLEFIVPVFPCRWGTPRLFQKFAQPFLHGQFPHQLTVRWDSISLQIVLTELLLLHRILRGNIGRTPQRSAQTVPNLLLWWFVQLPVCLKNVIFTLNFITSGSCFPILFEIIGFLFDLHPLLFYFLPSFVIIILTMWVTVYL